MHVPSPPFRRILIYHQKSASWNHIRGYFHRAHWDKLKSEPISDAVDRLFKWVFQELLLNGSSDNTHSVDNTLGKFH